MAKKEIDHYSDLENAARILHSLWKKDRRDAGSLIGKCRDHKLFKWLWKYGRYSLLTFAAAEFNLLDYD